jgi:hypothetical protein
MTTYLCLQEEYMVAPQYCILDACGARLTPHVIGGDCESRDCCACQCPVDRGTLVILRNTQHTPYSTQHTPHTPHPKSHTTQHSTSELYTLNHTRYTLHSTLYTLHSTLYTLHSTHTSNADTALKNRDSTPHTKQNNTHNTHHRDGIAVTTTFSLGNAVLWTPRPASPSHQCPMRPPLRTCPILTIPPFFRTPP